MNTHFILPSWWVKAYEAAALAEAGEESAMQQALAAGLAPALSVLELNALAVIIGSLQDQLIAGQKTLVVNPNEHGKHVSTSVKTRRFAFEKVTQLLASLTVLGSAHSGAGSVTTFKPFAQDTWRRRIKEEQLAEWLIELSLTARGAEMLFGLSDAYTDALAQIRGEPDLALSCNNEPPLSLWRSVWHELQGPEQLVLMRLERSMQWGFNWLTLEGTFGVPLRELSQNLKLAEGKGGDTELVRCLKLLAKLGKKLTEHGFLAPTPTAQYLALGTNGSNSTVGQAVVPSNGDHELTLVWQMSRERLMADAMPAYRLKVAACFLSRYLHAATGTPAVRSFEHVFVLVSGKPISASQTLYWREHWPKLVAAASSPTNSDILQPSQVTLLPLLFLEWTLRTEAGAALPLPDSLRDSDLAQVCRAVQEPLESRFERFKTVIETDSDWPRRLKEEPWACLVSVATRQTPEFKDYGQRLKAAGLVSSVGGSAIRPQGAERAAGVAESALDLPSEKMAPRAQAALSGALAARMRRTASDELQKMRSQYPDKYKDLQRAYLESLDEPGRKLLLDVQRRMQSSLFEEHLRQRLVRFMVENPGSWRSVDPRAAAPRQGSPLTGRSGLPNF